MRRSDASNKKKQSSSRTASRHPVTQTTRKVHTAKRQNIKKSLHTSNNIPQQYKKRQFSSQSADEVSDNFDDALKPTKSFGSLEPLEEENDEPLPPVEFKFDNILPDHMREFRPGIRHFDSRAILDDEGRYGIWRKPKDASDNSADDFSMTDLDAEDPRDNRGPELAIFTPSRRNFDEELQRHPDELQRQIGRVQYEPYHGGQYIVRGSIVDVTPSAEELEAQKETIRQYYIHARNEIRNEKLFDQEGGGWAPDGMNTEQEIEWRKTRYDNLPPRAKQRRMAELKMNRVELTDEQIDELVEDYFKKYPQGDIADSQERDLLGNPIDPKETREYLGQFASLWPADDPTGRFVFPDDPNEGFKLLKSGKVKAKPKDRNAPAPDGWVKDKDGSLIPDLPDLVLSDHDPDFYTERPHDQFARQYVENMQRVSPQRAKKLTPEHIEGFYEMTSTGQHTAYVRNMAKVMRNPIIDKVIAKQKHRKRQDKSIDLTFEPQNLSPFIKTYRYQDRATGPGFMDISEEKLKFDWKNRNPSLPPGPSMDYSFLSTAFFKAEI